MRLIIIVHRERVSKNVSRFLKAHFMLCAIRFCFLFVPGESHLTLYIYMHIWEAPNSASMLRALAELIEQLAHGCVKL